MIANVGSSHRNQQKILRNHAKLLKKNPKQDVQTIQRKQLKGKTSPIKMPSIHHSQYDENVNRQVKPKLLYTEIINSEVYPTTEKSINIKRSRKYVVACKLSLFSGK